MILTAASTTTGGRSGLLKEIVWIRSDRFMRFVFFVVIGRDLGKYGQDSELLISLKRGFENSNWSKKIDFLELFMTKFVSFLGVLWPMRLIKRCPSMVYRDLRHSDQTVPLC
jgi:hypothetical protein